MVSSLQAVGVILLLGLLLAPAATVYMLCDSFPRDVVGRGIDRARRFRRRTGPLESRAESAERRRHRLVLGVMFFVAYLFSPRYGIIGRLVRRRHLHEESLARWPKDRE
jgi:hypothetical protein